MSKIMLAEDDDSLREIYGIRLTAEGYNVVTARDGEEALAIAVKERPDLVVSDVMMPKISGFDMLDILRSTPATQDVKVIMMTALSTEEQRARGESLGADRYLVKSQVGIEDVVNAVHEVLGDRAENGVISSSTPANDAAAPVATETVVAVGPEVATMSQVATDAPISSQATGPSQIGMASGQMGTMPGQIATAPNLAPAAPITPEVPGASQAPTVSPTGVTQPIQVVNAQQPISAPAPTGQPLAGPLNQPVEAQTAMPTMAAPLNQLPVMQAAPTTDTPLNQPAIPSQPPASA